MAPAWFPPPNNDGNVPDIFVIKTFVSPAIAPSFPPPYIAVVTLPPLTVMFVSPLIAALFPPPYIVVILPPVCVTFEVPDTAWFPPPNSVVTVPLLTVIFVVAVSPPALLPPYRLVTVPLFISIVDVVTLPN